MIVYIFQIIVSILLIICVLLQASEGGLSPAFGGGGEMFRSKRTVEKFLLFMTIFLAFILAALSLSLIIFPQK
jgi:protein translocase SecG subunit